MFKSSRLLAPAALVVLAVLPAAAQTRDVPRDAPGRFTMQPIEGGFLRLDTQTGAVSTCRAGSGNLVLCQPAQEEQRNLGGEIDRLRAENGVLRAENKRLREAAGPGLPPPPAVAEPPAEKFQLPTEEDVDQALDYVERMFKKFRDRLRNLEEDGTKKPGTPL